MTKINDLEDIPPVKLWKLPVLRTISGSGRNYYVGLRYSPSVYDFSSVAVAHCTQVSAAYDVLSKVPRLKIIRIDL